MDKDKTNDTFQGHYCIIIVYLQAFQNAKDVRLSIKPTCNITQLQCSIGKTGEQLPSDKYLNSHVTSRGSALERDGESLGYKKQA